jgi:PEP-CTERM motif-containing protein
LTVTLLLFSSLLHANSIPLTQGEIVERLDSFGSLDLEISFQGKGVTFDVLGLDDFLLTPGLHQCFQGCSFSDIVKGFGLVQFSGPGAGVLNGQLIGLAGVGIAFGQRTTAVVLAPSGLLTISGVAFSTGFFFPCNPPENPNTCLVDVDTVIFAQDHGQWKYLAHFVPDPTIENGFILKDLMIFSTPEPGTLLLVGTGMTALGFFRRRRKRPNLPNI